MPSIDAETRIPGRVSTPDASPMKAPAGSPLSHGVSMPRYGLTDWARIAYPLHRTDSDSSCLGEHADDRAHRLLRHTEVLTDLRGRHLALSFCQAAKDISVELAPEIG